jgi:hypothetical protein
MGLFYWEVGRSLKAKPVQGVLKLDIYLDNSAKNTFLQRYSGHCFFFEELK